ncbi:MAG: hypothetical protein HYW08_16340 [candidate division NC10 bacterium]|nr:hypothetical protein [Candidatus Rokubacteria bacterium]MBI2563916.1 hypothetical protein [candidate division NC10 bacterium]
MTWGRFFIIPTWLSRELVFWRWRRDWRRRKQTDHGSATAMEARWGFF